ncbi:bifunctional diguanylate cyclase/phosphodiesterase [Oxalobacteraceae bacterium CAVE-383]|nr:bifunctional diguanylate cyclase/phosphodiesterase [Oxalobacteraceae bacterium CAVE-383]
MLAASYDPGIVAVSILVAMLASYTALDMANRIALNRNTAARWWLAGGSLAMGIGIWSMHFIGMLAFRLPIPLSYNIWLTLLSLVVAIAVSAFALWQVSLPQLPYRRLLGGALAMGAGIAAMHYLGMASMHMSPGIIYDARWFALSLLIAVGAAGAALWIAFHLRQQTGRHGVPARACAAVVMGLAISGMHYTGMTAAHFPLGSVCMGGTHNFSAGWLAVVVVLGTLSVLTIALLTSVLDARLETRTAKLAHSLARANQELTQQALHDGLTQLPNRMLFEDRLDQELQNAARERRHFALMFIDLDGFKAINDGLGHHIGDLLLIEVARAIQSLMVGGDTVARLGGDEFVVLAEVAQPEDAAQIAERLVGLIGQPFMIESHELQVSASIGIAIYPEDGGSRHEMLVNADAAMYHTKRSGRNGYHFFAPSMNANAHNKLQLLNEMRHAIEHREFVVYYQPKFATVDHRVLGAEALVRWQHPVRGLMPPDEFIPLAEKSGMIVPLGAWVLDQACAQMREWIDLGHGDWKMAVNLSAVQFAHEGLLEVVQGALARHNLPPHCLTLEVTETTAMDDVDASMITLEKIAALGVDISIDDFGTGYSSLLYLKRLPANELKIDRGFVRNLSLGSDDEAIVAAVVALGRALNLRIVAEGVETEAQQLFLDEAGCDALQGYLLGRPMPAAQFIDAIDETVTARAAEAIALMKGARSALS